MRRTPNHKLPHKNAASKAHRNDFARRYLRSTMYAIIYPDLSQTVTVTIRVCPQVSHGGAEDGEHGVDVGAGDDEGRDEADDVRAGVDENEAGGHAALDDGAHG